MCLPHKCQTRIADCTSSTRHIKCVIVAGIAAGFARRLYTWLGAGRHLDCLGVAEGGGLECVLGSIQRRRRPVHGI